MMFGRGYLGNNGCFGFFGMWHYIIIIGISLIVLAIWWNKRRNDKPNSDNALRILDIKYANGEITEEEYISRKNTLNRKEVIK